MTTTQKEAHVIEVHQLKMHYGEKDVLKDVNFSIRRGEVLAPLGPNGAGKTSTIEILEGFRIVSGRDIRVLNPEALASWLPPEGMSGHIDMFDPREGGTYRVILTYEMDRSTSGKTSENTDVAQGKFLELVPDRRHRGRNSIRRVIIDSEWY